MPETESIVINTGPLLALIAGYGDLSFLKKIYKRVLVPFEVCREIEAGGANAFGLNEFVQSDFIEKQTAPLEIVQFLKNSLDLGEASVIQLALNQNISTVCIDEAVGRRIARLNGLCLTGSVGVLLCPPALIGVNLKNHGKVPRPPAPAAPDRSGRHHCRIRDGTGGRIVNHLKNDLFFVGFQAKGTPGRAIVEGHTPAKAAIHRLSGYSAHADQQTLCDWVKAMPEPPWEIRLVHVSPTRDFNYVLDTCKGFNDLAGIKLTSTTYKLQGIG